MTVQAISPQRQLTPVEQFRLQVLPPERQRELRVSLPSHVRPELFERNFHNALMQNAWLMQHDPRLVYREIMKAAALGLLLDPQLGEGYLLEAWDGKLQRKVPQFRAGYRGLMKLARQSGEVSLVYAHAVHKLDKVECHLGTDKRLIHEPNAFGERGEVVGYYAVVKFKDGQTDFEPMNKPDVDRIRDKSEGYKAFAAGKIKSTPWSTDYDEMARKTALRRLMKRLPQSPDLAGALSHEDAADEGLAGPIDITPPPTGAQAVAEALAGPVDEPQEPYETEPAGDAVSPRASETAAELGAASPAHAEPAAVSLPIPEVAEMTVPLMPNGKTPNWPAYSGALQEAAMAAPSLDWIEAFRKANRAGLNGLFKGNQDEYKTLLNVINTRKSELATGGLTP